MTLLNIESLAIDSTSNDLVVILSSAEGEILPIWIGNMEAISIAMVLSKTKPRRPMTHDLLYNILKGLEIKLVRVIISALVDNIYYALIYLQKGDELIVIDARPSDSIAIALRVGAPIFADKDIPLVPVDEDNERRKRLEERLRKVEPEQLLGG